MTQPWQPTNEQGVGMTVAQGTPRTDALRRFWSAKEGARNSTCSPEAHSIYSLADSLEREVAALSAQVERITTTHKALMANADAMRDELSAQVVELQKLYNELLYAVARKHPDE